MGHHNHSFAGTAQERWNYSTSVIDPIHVRTGISGDLDTRISLTLAAALTMRYRKQAPAGSIKAGFFARNIFEKLMAQVDCIGIKVHFARTSGSAQTFVLVGIDSTRSNILNGIIGEEAYPCPPLCPVFNRLNSDFSARPINRDSSQILFTGNENHCITLAEAKRMVEAEQVRNPRHLVAGAFISRASVEELLDQSGCVGIRFYFARGESGELTLLSVGVEAAGDDQVHGAIFCGLRFHDNAF